MQIKSIKTKDSLCVYIGGKVMKKSLVNGLKKALLAVSVMAAVAAVSPKSVDAAVKMEKTKVTCTAKERFNLKVKGTSKKATWTSSNKSIATVTKKGGNVVTKRAGRVTITAKVGSKKVKCRVTVKKAAPKPYLTATSKTLRVGESFLLIQGQYTDYESTFSYNDHIATIDPVGRVVATGIGQTKVLVNRGKDAQGRYRDYICTINVVAGTAPACKHQWMDTYKYNSKGVIYDTAYRIKTCRDEVYTECKVCHNKFLYDAEYEEHEVKTEHFAGSITAGGGWYNNYAKFSWDFYCSKCGLQRD